MRANILPAAALALALAACGGSATPTEPSEPVVAMTNFAFEPADVAFDPGNDVQLVNESETTHTFTIEDAGIDLQVRAHRSANVVLDLAPRTYEVECSIHLLHGMRMRLTILG